MHNKKVNVTIKIVGLISFLFLCGYNAKNNINFFTVDIYQILSMIIAVIVAYFLVQIKNDERKRKEVAEHILDDIQVVCQKIISEINNPECMCKDVWRELLMNKRRLGNKVKALKEIVDGFETEKILEDIHEKYFSCSILIGKLAPIKEKINVEIQTEIEKNLSLLDERCDDIKVHLYRKK